MDGQTDTEVTQTDRQADTEAMRADGQTDRCRRTDTQVKADGYRQIQADRQTDRQGYKRPDRRTGRGWIKGRWGQTDTGQSGRTDGQLGWGG